MNTNKFIEESKKVASILKLPYETPEEIICPYREKIEDNRENINEIIQAFMDNGKETLIIAPTGSGKTYSINTAFKEMNHRYGKSNMLNILVTPNKIQSAQNETLYDMQAVIGGGKDVGAFDFSRDNSFSCVADKASRMIQILPEYVHINLCIDEAHTLLVESVGYRREAIRQLDKLAKEVLKKNGSVVYMTATPHPLVNKHFDRIIRFNKAGYKAPAGELDLVINKKGTDTVNSLYQFLSAKIKEGFIPFVRLNSKKDTMRICQKLMEDGIQCLYVDSSAKGSTTFRNPITDQIETVYDNIMFHGIVTKACLPAKTKKGNAIQIYFTTSMLETGTNITSIDGVQNDRLMPVFVCQNFLHMIPTAAVQFFNRVRYHVQKYVFYLQDTEKDPEKIFRGMAQICASEQEKVLLTIPTFSNVLISLQQLYGEDQERVRAGIEALLNMETVNEKRNDLNCIIYDVSTKKLVVDRFLFWKNIYDSWCKQFFFHHDTLAEFLQEELGVRVVIIENGPGGGPGVRLNSQDQINETMIKIANDENLAKQVKNNKVTDEDIKSVMYTETWQDMKEMVNAGVPVEEAAQKAAIGDIKENNRAKFNAVRDQAVKEMDQSNYGLLSEVISHKRQIHEITVCCPDDERLIRIAKSAMAPIIRKGLKLGMTMQSLMKKASQSAKLSDLKNFVRDYQYKTLNMHFLRGEYSYFAGAAGIEQFIVLKLLYQTNQAGNLIQTVLTDEVLNTIASEINKSLYGIKNTSYTKRHAMDLCRRIFQIRNNPWGLSIIGLKTC